MCTSWTLISGIKGSSYQYEQVLIVGGSGLQEKISALIGIVGGIVDLFAGFAILQGTTEPMMMRPASDLWVGYFLLALGIVVFLTGLWIFRVRMMQHSTIGWLMVLYGVIMLILGVGMIGQIFTMMQGSTVSGSIMIILGIAMLYSGFGMVRVT